MTSWFTCSAVSPTPGSKLDRGPASTGGAPPHADRPASSGATIAVPQRRGLPLFDAEANNIVTRRHPECPPPPPSQPPAARSPLPDHRARPARRQGKLFDPEAAEPHARHPGIGSENQKLTEHLSSVVRLAHFSTTHTPPAAKTTGTRPHRQRLRRPGSRYLSQGEELRHPRPRHGSHPSPTELSNSSAAWPQKKDPWTTSSQTSTIPMQRPKQRASGSSASARKLQDEPRPDQLPPSPPQTRAVDRLTLLGHRSLQDILVSDGAADHRSRDPRPLRRRNHAVRRS